MSRREEENTYKIGQAASIIDVKTSVLRFWEGEFDQLEPIRTPSGQRLYSEEHIVLLRRIRELLYDEGLTIEGARKKLESDADFGSDESATLVAEDSVRDLPLFSSYSNEDSKESVDRNLLLQIRDELKSIMALLD